MESLLATLFLLALGAVPYLGLRPMVREFVRTLGEASGMLSARLRLWYVSFMARKVVTGLCIAAGIHMLLALVTTRIVGYASPLLVIGTAVIVITELVLALWQSPAIARRVIGENGDVLRYPPYVLDNQGFALDRQGALASFGGYPVTLDATGIPIDHLGGPVNPSLLVEHPLADKPLIAEREFRPSRLSTSGSVLLIFLAFSVTAAATAYEGARLDSVSMIIMGLVNAVIAFIPLKIICELIAGAADLGAGALKLVGGLGLHEAVPVLSGLSISVRPSTPTDVAAIGRNIRRVPVKLAVQVFTAFAWVFVFRGTNALGGIMFFIVLLAVTDVPLFLSGDEDHVRRRWRSLARFQSIVAPPLAIVRLLWDLALDENERSLIRRMVTGFGQWPVDFLSGQVGISVGSMPHILGAVVVTGLLVWFFLAVGGGMTKGHEAETLKRGVREFFLVCGGLTALLLAWQGFLLLARTGGMDEIRLPPIASSVELPAAPRTLSWFPWHGAQAHITWVDASDNETGFRVERALYHAAYVPVANLPANTTEWTDPSASPGIGYMYRVIATARGMESTASNETCLLMERENTAPENAAVSKQGSRNARRNGTTHGQ